MPWRSEMTQDPTSDTPPPVTGDDDEILTWDAICRSDEFRGRWVALDACKYDEVSGRATAGQVVDADESLTDLCERVREADRRSCAIMFCEDALSPAH
jgi:hypothetical protein